jgi:hypothetical protein
VTMAENEQRLEQVQERIDDARAAAEQAEPDLLPQASSPADDTFQPSGDDRQAGENPSEGADRDAPGELEHD